MVRGRSQRRRGGSTFSSHQIHVLITPDPHSHHTSAEWTIRACRADAPNITYSGAAKEVINRGVSPRDDGSKVGTIMSSSSGASCIDRDQVPSRNCDSLSTLDSRHGTAWPPGLFYGAYLEATSLPRARNPAQVGARVARHRTNTSGEAATQSRDKYRMSASTYVPIGVSVGAYKQHMRAGKLLDCTNHQQLPCRSTRSEVRKKVLGL
eukprot:352616-Chlamydomonas_euryale.AAC.8